METPKVRHCPLWGTGQVQAELQPSRPPVPLTPLLPLTWPQGLRGRRSSVFFWTQWADAARLPSGGDFSRWAPCAVLLLPPVLLHGVCACVCAHNVHPGPHAFGSLHPGEADLRGPEGPGWGDHPVMLPWGQGDLAFSYYPEESKWAGRFLFPFKVLFIYVFMYLCIYLGCTRS